MSNARVWQSTYNERTRTVRHAFYLRGYSHAHSRKVWRELPPAVRRVNQQLRDSLQPVAVQDDMSFDAQPDKWRARFAFNNSCAWRAFYGSTGK